MSTLKFFFTKNMMVRGGLCGWGGLCGCVLTYMHVSLPHFDTALFFLSSSLTLRDSSETFKLGDLRRT